MGGLRRHGGGRLTVLRAGLDLYHGGVNLNAALSDARLQVYEHGDGVLALVATLAPETGGIGAVDHAVDCDDVLIEPGVTEAHSGC